MSNNKSSVSLSKLLDEIIPDLLLKLINKYDYSIVGYRSIQKFVTQSLKTKKSNLDWEILLIGNETVHKKFIKDIIEYLNSFKIIIKKELVEPDKVFDIHNYYSRPYYKLYTAIEDKINLIMTIFIVPNKFLDFSKIKQFDNLNYNDMGYLFRELYSKDDMSESILKNASKIDKKDIETIFENMKELNEDISVDMDIIEEDFETISTISDKGEEIHLIPNLLNEIRKELSEFKEKIKEIVNIKEFIFVTIFINEDNKEYIKEVNNLCRKVEYYLNKYQSFLEKLKSEEN